MKLSGEASDKCTFNGRAHCDLDMIRKYNEGLICTTACVSSMFNHALREDRLDDALMHIDKLQSIFNSDSRRNTTYKTLTREIGALSYSIDSFMDAL